MVRGVEKKQFSVILPNKPGALADFSEKLAKNGVNIQAISGEGGETSGVIRIITDDVRSTEKALNGSYRYVCEAAYLVKLKNRPGELAKMSRKISNAGININFLYVYGTNENEMILAINTNKMKETKEVLRV